MGDALRATDTSRARDCYRKAAQIWEGLRDSKQLALAYAGKAEELRRAAAAVGAVPEAPARAAR
jgi:hypothetical protein